MATHNYIVDYFSKRIDGFNKRSLTYDDLAFECERSGITIVFDSFEEARGGSLWADEDKFIFLSDALTEPEKVITGFHEFCHLEFDPPGNLFMSTGNLWNWRKCEKQANIIGMLALMPDVEVTELSIELLMNEYGISREIAEYRLALMQRR